LVVMRQARRVNVRIPNIFVNAVCSGFVRFVCKRKMRKELRLPVRRACIVFEPRRHLLPLIEHACPAQTRNGAGLR
jgi:hypothetical protein